MNKITNIKP